MDSSNSVAPGFLGSRTAVVEYSVVRNGILRVAHLGVAWMNIPYSPLK